MKIHSEDCLDANDDTSVFKGKCICPKQNSAIESILANDEASSDEDLFEHFKNEFKLSENDARGWLSKRNAYLKAI